MKNTKFNGNKRIYFMPKNNNINKNQNVNNNKKENNKIINKSPYQKSNNINIKNNNDKKILNKPQQKIIKKDRNKKVENKKLVSNANTITNEINKSEIKDERKPLYNLKLSKEELYKIINNNKNFPVTSKLKISQSNDNIYNYNNRNKTLKYLNEKQNSLFNIINKINSKRSYIKECSLNNLYDKNGIYKNIQNQKMKLLDNDKNNYINKIELVQQQIYHIKCNNPLKTKKKDELEIHENKDNITENNSRFKELKKENDKRYENFKNADLKFKEKLNHILLTEKKQKEKQFEELKEKIKKTHSLEKKYLEETNLEASKNRKYINCSNKRGNTEDYLYYKLEKSFEEKEKEYLNISKINKKNIEDDINKDKLRKEYLNKKKKEMKSKMNDLHKMWKERNNKLPKYKSQIFEKILISEEDKKRDELDKVENKKLLYINKEKYIEKKIQLPPINYLLKKESSQRKITIKKIKTSRNQLIKLTKTKSSPAIDNNLINSNSNVSLENSYNNQNHKTNKLIGNISLKSRKLPGDFNYLNEIKKERLLKSNKDNYLTNNKNINQSIETEKGSVKLLEEKYNMNKKLLRIKGGYANNIDLGNENNQILINSIENKLNIVENMVKK